MRNRVDTFRRSALALFFAGCNLAVAEFAGSGGNAAIKVLNGGIVWPSQ